MKSKMKKPMVIMLSSVGVLFGLIFGWKFFQSMMIARYMKAGSQQAITVSTMKVEKTKWRSQLKATGSFSAINGIDITNELPGVVQDIYFKSGTTAKKDDVLIRFNADSEVASLQSLQAEMKLAELTFDRDKIQFKSKFISRQALDTDEQKLKSVKGRVDQQASIVQKKLIRAPFDGRIGIRRVNAGEYVNAGTKIVSFQALNPIFFHFYIPQQQLASVKIGQKVEVFTDAYPNKEFSGNITAIDASVDNATRNILIEATVQNPRNELLPGMFGQAQVFLGEEKNLIGVPQTSVTFNPYGNIVYRIEKAKDDTSKLIATQIFVQTGEARGDEISILKGLKPGDEIVTSGQIKLQNGSPVKINNEVQPDNQTNPIIQNEQ